MTQQSFISRREILWNEFEIMIRGGKKTLKAKAASFPRLYRELAQDLNTARAHGFDPFIIERLNALVLDGNRILYGGGSFSLKSAADFLTSVFPQAVRRSRRSFAFLALVFYGIAFFSAFLCMRFPGMAAGLLGENQAWQLEQMYNPAGEHFLVPREVSSDADMFGFYIYNNISIAFQTFAGGILAGFGSLFVLCFNALFLGAAAGHIINEGYASSFFSFIIAHGAFELTAILFSAQGGLLLGYSLFITKGLSRSASLKEAGKTALPLISGAAIMLAVAAAIEAFWSSRHEFPLPLRYGAGGFCWALLAFYFIFSGRTKK